MIATNSVALACDRAIERLADLVTSFRSPGGGRSPTSQPSGIPILPPRPRWPARSGPSPMPRPIAQHAPIWRVVAGVSPGQRRAAKRRAFVQGLS